ncbi:alpha/beta fold hydrolase [Streptomyces sp. NPDC054797]
MADVPEFPPTPAERVLPSVLRGLALADLPPPAAITALRQPALVLAWADDPGHPLSTAVTLADRLPGARLLVARTRAEVGTWGERMAEFLSRPPHPG